MRRITSLWALAFLAGCEQAEPLADWSLVGVYDASALVQAGLVGEEEAGGAQYVWVAPGGMRKSCGPAKAPDGLGLFEGEAMANRLTPTLAILLERNGEGDAPMTLDDVKVSLGMPDESGQMKPSFALQPAVMPRYVSVRIEGDAETRHKQVVRNQLVMELCMEHKTGRGWIGGDRTQLREAFLLDPPAGKAGIDRKFFGGQRDPIPALLGPSDACMQQVIEDTAQEKAQKAAAEGGRGDGSLSLVPSDVWGASLRQCGPEEVQGSEYVGTKPVPITLGDTNEQPNRQIRAQWTELVATLKHGETDLDVKIDLTWGDQKLIDDKPLMEQPKDKETGKVTGPPGVSDLLQRVPHTYPLVGTAEDRGRYTVLLIPNWQIVEGLRRIDVKTPKEPRETPGDGIQDGVGFVIDNPEYLYVLLEPRHAEGEPPPAPPEPVEGEGGGDGQPPAESWPNVAEPLAGGPFGLMRWGYSPGMLSGRSPIALPGSDEPTWEQVKMAHNAELHASFLLAAVVLVGLGFLGTQRLRDLWANLPEERVDFWPVGDGLPPEKDDAPAPKVPEAGG